MGHFLLLTTCRIPDTGCAPCDHSSCWEPPPRSYRSPWFLYETPLPWLVLSSPREVAAPCNHSLWVLP